MKNEDFIDKALKSLPEFKAPGRMVKNTLTTLEKEKKIFRWKISFAAILFIICSLSVYPIIKNIQNSRSVDQTISMTLNNQALLSEMDSNVPVKSTFQNCLILEEGENR